MPIEEGARYAWARLLHWQQGGAQHPGLRSTFAVKDGEWFNATMMGKGLENLKKAYGQMGYINFGAIPKATFDEQKKTVTWTSTSTRASHSMSRASSSRATPSPRQGHPRELMLEEGRSTTRSCGSTAAAPQPAGVL